VLAFCEKCDYCDEGTVFKRCLVCAKCFCDWHAGAWGMDVLQMEFIPACTEISSNEWNNFLGFTHGYDEEYHAAFIKFQN
jgi:hypothetical protein